LATSILDPRVESFAKMTLRWRRERGPERAVIDQVYLVADMPGFLEAISTWDERSFFPVLFDDPAWTLPFLRAFRPRRVVRVVPNSPPRDGPFAVAAMPLAAESPAMLQRLWRAAERAVARAWTTNEAREVDLPFPGAAPARLGPTPPGLVFSNPESPMLAGAVALAAGRFQPLVRLDPIPSAPGSLAGNKPRRPVRGFHDVLSLNQAKRLARLVETRAAVIASPHAGLGDRCDFVTLAVDWPYRYQNDVEEGVVRGEHALDDLIGRVLDTEEGGLASSRTRWAFTGRLLGGPAASVYRAMCALFLHPGESLLWDTYNDAGVRRTYRMNEAAAVLGQLWPGITSPLHRSGAEANVAAWHRVLDPISRFGWIMVNSSGFPRRFAISGGEGVPADLPRGRPAAVSFIHSFSAADPLDSSTLAGRWLENGAYVYFGAMNEPYLHAFRPPRLIAELAAAEVPLGAALRQGEQEQFGRPWRLVYLGDPLYRFSSVKAQSCRNRIAPAGWRAGTIEPTLRPVEVITANLPPLDPTANAATQLQGCLTAAMAVLCQPDPGQDGIIQAPIDPPDLRPWQAALTAIDRQELERARRPVLDELVIDTLLSRGELSRVDDWLERVPPAECRPRLWDALESTVMSRLAELVRAQSVGPVLDLWERTIRRPWPSGSAFPSQLTDRLTRVVDSDPDRYREAFRRRVTEAAAARDFAADQSPYAAIIKSELARMNARDGSAAGSH
jgi:hypothetical protein